jgi:hypothetical protein
MPLINGKRVSSEDVPCVVTPIGRVEGLRAEIERRGIPDPLVDVKREDGGRSSRQCSVMGAAMTCGKVLGIPWNENGNFSRSNKEVIKLAK